MALAEAELSSHETQVGFKFRAWFRALASIGTTYWQGKVTRKTRKGENMAERRSIRFVAFIVRCAAAATCAYGAAILTGLPHPVWAAISALVVSQERLGETGASLLWRIAGTLIGLCVAVAAGTRHPVSCRLDLGIAYRQDNIPRSSS